MGTSSLICIEDSLDKFYIYCHYDSFPERMFKIFKEAQKYTWNDRDDANDYTCAIISILKDNKPGNVKIIKSLNNIPICNYYYKIKYNYKYKIWQFTGSTGSSMA